MKIWVGVTHYEWFEFLAKRLPDEINFWQPTGSFTFRAIEPGCLFLFKLHSPQNFIVGGGFFVRYTRLPLTLAWEAFGEKNGASSFEALRAQINKYLDKINQGLDQQIGCIILNKPFFLAKEAWIPAPSDWSPNLVRGKTYDSQEGNGLFLWNQIQERLKSGRAFSYESASVFPLVADERPRYGPEYITHARLGQGAFRVVVLDAYKRQCAITGERVLPVLSVAHIKPFAKSGPNLITNGLLLRTDLHILFDRGYLTVSPKLVTEVSKRIKDDFENGHNYYQMHGCKLHTVPDREEYYPDPKFIQWHNENVFLH